ncbi:MAG: hypothetical protein U9Q82_00410 [Chloroflexota bacterium]|nr:hypothetical protein [Chloroflexota bacterium]
MCADHEPKTISNSKRPLPVTLLVVVVLSLTSLPWFGLHETWQHWDFLHTLPLSAPVLYLALTDAFWGLAGLALTWGLWTGRTWAWKGAQVAALGYALFYWLDKLVFASPEVIQARWPFCVGATAMGLIFCFGVLWPPRSRCFFERSSGTEN